MHIVQIGKAMQEGLVVFAPATGPPLELVLDHIIERKRMDDLSRSIIDRRFAEQKVIEIVLGL